MGRNQKSPLISPPLYVLIEHEKKQKERVMNISIVIVTYNRIPALCELLESIFAVQLLRLFDRFPGIIYDDDFIRLNGLPGNRLQQFTQSRNPIIRDYDN